MYKNIIYHHLGLGDHIICHGIVREYAQRYGELGLFCKSCNYDSVKAMYSDIPVTIIKVADDYTARAFMKSFTQFTFHSIGFKDLNDTEQFDYQFYKLAGVPFEYRHTKFLIPSNTDKEDELVKIKGKKEPFALVHDDLRRNYLIDRNKINLPCVNVEKIPGFELSNYIGLIKQASEIHVIDSSFMFMVDYLNLDLSGKGLFIHRYARPNQDWLLPSLVKNWNIINA